MKLLAVLCLSLVAGAMGGVLYPGVGAGGVGYGGGFGVGGVGVGGVGVVGVDGAGKVAAVGNQVSDVVRDWAQNANAATQWNNAAKNYGRDQNDYGNNAAKANSKAQAAGSDYGNQASNWDQSNAARNAAADKAAASSASANQWASNNDANRYDKDQVWSQGNAWRQGQKKNDNIDYAYDKKFDLKDSNNGGFEYGEKLNSHALDDFADRAAAYDRNVDKAAAQASSADAQSADHKSAASSNAAAADSNWDKFARNQDSAANANGRDKDWAQKLDASQGGNRLWSDARKSASDVYKDLALGDWNYDRKGQGYGAKDVDGYGAGAYGAGYGAGNPYAYGVAGAGGYAAKPGYYPGYGADYAKAAGIQDAARAWDQAAASKLRQGDLAATEDVTKADYRQDSWLNDRDKGFDRNQASKANDAGFSDWAQQAARAANAADAKSADAASKWARDQAQAKFNEDLWKKDAESKRLSDRDLEKKVWGNNYNNKLKSGDDWERLKYDRNQADDVYGYDTAQKKDWAQGSNANAWNSAYDANRNNAEAARAAESARNAQNNDWKKDAQGWENAKAAAQDNAAANQNGWNNAAWKQEQDAAAADLQARNQQAWDKGSDRNAVGGKTYGAYDGGRAVYPVGGVIGGYGGYPDAGYVGAYPAYGAGYGAVYPAGGYAKGGYFGGKGYYYYGQQAANHDNTFNAASNAASKAAASAASANQWAQNNDANRYAKDQVWSDNNAWRNGRRNNDGVDYAYDKKYDLKDSINGGFEYGEKVNSHALDDFVDRAGTYDRNADANAARAAAADNQWAAKKSAWAQNAAAADSNKDDFARKQDSAASANGRDKDWAQKLDASQGGSRIWSDARQAAGDVYNDLVNADSDYKRVALGAKAKDVDAYGANPYAYGVAGVGGYAALPGYYPGGGADYAAAAGVKDAGSARDNAAVSKLRQGDLAATSDLTKAQYIQNKWLADRTRGYDRNQAAAADDAGFSDWASQNARTANAADAQNADAASQSARDQAASKFNEDLWKKDEARKRLSDRDLNKRVWGNNYNNKQRGGDNWERLKYNRDQADDVFGYDKSEKKDWAQAANDNRWNAAFDANKKQQEAAQAANAAQNAQNSDWRKAAQGWNNANAAAQDNAAAGQNGFNNGAWDQDQANALYHAQAQNNDVWHKDAGRSGADAGGYYGADGNFGPGVVGFGYPAGGAGTGTLGAYGGSGYGYKG